MKYGTFYKLQKLNGNVNRVVKRTVDSCAMCLNTREKQLKNAHMYFLSQGRGWYKYVR